MARLENHGHSTILIDLGADEFDDTYVEDPNKTKEDDALFGEWISLVQTGTSRQTVIKDTHPTPVTLLLPEAKRLDEYESPLTHELMQERYAKLYSAYTEGGLCSKEVGSAEWEAARQEGKKEITSKFLHKPGLPSEFMRYLDIDIKETRQLLDTIYFGISIPDDVDRDNNVTNFDRRARLVKNHILAMHNDDPDIKEKLQNTIDIWRADLLLRAEIMGDSPEPTLSPLATERQEYLDDLVEGRRQTWDAIEKIGSTLLHASDDEKVTFEQQVARLKPESDRAIGGVALLLTFIQSHHPVK